MMEIDPGLLSNLMETSLQNLMKEIGDAVKLDDESRDKEAFAKYTICVYKISSNLLLDIKASQFKFVVSPTVSRQVKLLQHCVERVDSLTEKMGKEVTPLGAKEMPQPTRPSQLDSSSNRTDQQQPRKSQSFDSVQRPSGVKPGMEVNPANSPSIHIPVPALPPENNPHVYSKGRLLTPLEKAHAQNRSLIIAYKARMNRLNKSDFNAYNYSVTLQRKMAENLAIAKAQEEELAKKMKARQERLEAETRRRFAHPSGTTTEEKELREIYKSILAYENDVEWLSKWREKLEGDPEDPVLICQLVQEILRCSDHPFTEMLRKFQFKIYEQLYPLVVNRHPEIDEIEVGLPHHLWPTAEEVADLLSAFTLRSSVSSPETKRRKRIRSRGKNSESRSEVNADNSQIRNISEDNALDSTTSKARDKTGNETCLEDSCNESEITHITRFEGGDKESSLNEEQDTKSSSNLLREQDKAVDGLSAKDIESVCEKHDANKSAIPEESSLAVDNTDRTDVKDNESFCEQNASSASKSVEPVDSSLDKGSEEDGNHEQKKEERDNKDNKDTLSSQEEEVSDSEEDEKSGVFTVIQDNCQQLEEAHAKGKQLESELSLQRQQARLLMQQIMKDPENLGEENFDDLFDDDDGDEDDASGDIPEKNSGNPSSEVVLNPTKDVKPEAGQSSNGGWMSSHAENSAFNQWSSQGGQKDRMFASLPPISSLPDDKLFASLPTTGSPSAEKKDNSPSPKEDGSQDLSEMNHQAYQRHLAAVSKDVHCALDKLLRVMVVAYQALDTPVGKDQCAVALEEPFFKPVWKTLLRLFRLVNHRKEKVLACVMTKHKDAGPELMRVSPKFQLSSPTSKAKPYQEAITELLRLPQYYTIPCKLDCVVSVCRMICECVDKFYSDQRASEDGGPGTKVKSAPVLGADDLLPILTYVIIHSQCPQLISEGHAMSEFIAEGYMMGEEGYCLTTFKTAVEFLLSFYTPLEDAAGSADV